MVLLSEQHIPLNLSRFIANRIARNSSGSFSSTIHRIAVISIAFSLSALIVSFFVLFGFKEAIRDKVYNLSGHLTVNKYALSNSFEENWIQVGNEQMNLLDEFGYIEHYQSYILKAGLLKSDEGVQGIIVKGVGLDFDDATFSSQMIEGELPNFGETDAFNEIVLSSMLANMLRLDIGDNLTLVFAQEPPRFRRVQIAGVYATGMEEFDARMVLADITLLRKLNGWDNEQVTGLEVFVAKPEDMDRLEEDLFNRLPVEMNVLSAHRQYPQIFEWLNLLNRNVLILLIIIMVVAALGMISMVLILIMERTRMIGMLKALGGSNNLIRTIFVYTGIHLVLKGLLFGNGIGLLICFVQFQFQVIPLDMANYYMSTVPISFDWMTLLGLNVLMVVLISLTLLIPVRIVGGIQPVGAIRFD
jgi:lipoprotein-releasing system permease protein